MNKILFKRVQQKADLLTWVGLILFSVFILLILIQSLDALSLWMDEGFYYLATQKILDLGYPLFPSGHIYFKAIFYAYVSALFTRIFGFTVFNLRLISVLCTLALIPVVYLMGKRLFNRIVGLGAAVVFSLCVWVAEYGRVDLYFAPLQLVSFGGLYLFYRGFFEEKHKYKVLATATFVFAPLIHQLGMSVWFCYPAFFLIKGIKRFFRRDVLLSFTLTSVFYLLVQLHEYFFWEVGYVYAKTDQSIQGMIQYFFSSFSIKYFYEFYGSFPQMSIVIFAGSFLLLGTWFRERSTERSQAFSFSRNWLFLYLSLVFPIFFLGFFRTHVQPRYLYQLYPLFVILYAVSLYKMAQILIGLLTMPYARKRTAGFSAAAGVLFVILLFLTAEGVGVGKVKRIVNRQYGDPIQTDIITRSGRHQHYDHRGPGEYVRHFLQEDDLVVAIHVVFQHIYAGRVDYWLWSGGPGTWDAWEETSEGWKDFYIGARWINNLEDLRQVLEKNPDKRVWIIASPSILRRDHIKENIAQFIKSDPEKLVFRGKDGMSEVYLWNEAAKDLTGPAHALEGEWLPALFGKTVFEEETSRGSAFYVPKWETGGKLGYWTTEQTFSPGRYSISLRLKLQDFEREDDRLFGIALLKGPKGDQVASFIVNGDMVKKGAGYQNYKFNYYQSKESRLYLKFLFTGRGNVWLDYVDIEPVIETLTD
ncbi:MAG: glycosyltransferase family 39 protein [Candidatus Aminicenantaceae bacterium]